MQICLEEADEENNFAFYRYVRQLIKASRSEVPLYQPLKKRADLTVRKLLFRLNGSYEYTILKKKLLRKS